MKTFDIQVPTSQQVLYASWLLGGKTYTAAAVTSAPDCCAQINAATAAALARGPVKLVIDTNIAAGVPLIAASNLTIEGRGTTIYCRQGLNGPAITNPNWTSSCIGGTRNSDGSRSGYTTDYTGGHVVDSNIAITGRLTIVGNRGDGMTGNCTSGDPRVSAGNPSAGVNAGGGAGVPAGMFVCPVMFAGVKGLVLEGITVLDPPTYGVFPSNCFDIDARDITVLDPVTYAGGKPGFGRNTAGIQCVGPIARARFCRSTVSTADDGFAFNACDGNLSGSIALDAGPQVYAGWSSVYHGPMSDILVDGVFYPNCLNALRLLPGYDSIDRLTMRGVRGSLYGECLVAVPFSGAGDGSGTLGSILLDDWQFTLTGTVSGAYLCDLGFNSNLFEIRGWKARQAAAGCYNPGLFASAAVHANLRVHIDTYESVAAVQRPHLRVGGGATVAHGTVTGSRYRAGGLTAATTPAVQVDSGATANDIAVLGFSDDNGGGLASVAGTVGSLVVSNCRQLNGPTTQIGNTGTVSKLAGRGNVGLGTPSGTYGDKSTFETD